MIDLLRTCVIAAIVVSASNACPSRVFAQGPQSLRQEQQILMRDVKMLQSAIDFLSNQLATVHGPKDQPLGKRIREQIEELRRIMLEKMRTWLEKDGENCRKNSQSPNPAECPTPAGEPPLNDEPQPEKPKEPRSILVPSGPPPGFATKRASNPFFISRGASRCGLSGYHCTHVERP